MPAHGYALGVDLGTSHTVAMLRSPDGRIRPLLVDGSPLLPSAAYAEPDGTLLVGRDALHAAQLDPARLEPNPKRRIDEGTVLLGEREVPVTDLLAALLRRVVEQCHTSTAARWPQLTLTYPASWGAPRRDVLVRAATGAGFPQVRLVPEPVAAAAYFVRVLGREMPVGSALVVHDVGAGTFDATVVTRTADGFAVLAVDGRDDLGGLDVDAAVVGELTRAGTRRAPDAWGRLAAPRTVADRRARWQLWDDARTAKERLSRRPDVQFLVQLSGERVHLTRPELEALAEPVLAATAGVTRGLLARCALAPGRLAGVFLVGGSSRIPLPSTLLFRALDQAPVTIEQPELAVAEGSLLAGAQPVAGPSPGAAGPAVLPFPGALSSPAAQSFPGALSSPAALSSPFVLSSPGTPPSPAALSSPAARPSPTARSLPATLPFPVAPHSPAVLSPPVALSSPAGPARLPAGARVPAGPAPVRRRLRRLLVVPLVGASVLTVAAVLAALAVTGMVVYSVATGQGWLPDFIH